MIKLHFERVDHKQREWKISNICVLSPGEILSWFDVSARIRNIMGFDRNDYSLFDGSIFGNCLCVRFHNDADEAQFIILANSGAFDL